MPKKKSSKTSGVTKEESKDVQEKPSTGHSKKADGIDESEAVPEEPSTASLKKADEIDDIFTSQKRKKAEQEKSERARVKNEKSKKIKKKKRIPKETEPFNSDSKPRRRTNDGLAIYSEEELRINKQDAGSSGLCPFDCSCCF
ncbi:hypothetical protein BVRB_2g033310 [Beta vulgaris subsp. vulgaris]|uniref:DUF1764 domain-containing protein n=1 Tax=Beta vulgaris subsp. vulgaris TaxID=3555 RepID=A0A0J8CW92_BETVV|nr:uncharacterized protein C6G9.01c [Beta vulgaris subsp. vulgaris]KMT17985.1 hypothetical protein BVRB_2g033310 [Beta vulgaris subsp. vulgaris]